MCSHRAMSCTRTSYSTWTCGPRSGWNIFSSPSSFPFLRLQHRKTDRCKRAILITSTSSSSYPFKAIASHFRILRKTLKPSIYTTNSRLYTSRVPHMRSHFLRDADSYISLFVPLCLPPPLPFLPPCSPSTPRDCHRSGKPARVRVRVRVGILLPVHNPYPTRRYRGYWLTRRSHLLHHRPCR
jgi:hypothetical protein